MEATAKKAGGAKPKATKNIGTNVAKPAEVGQVRTRGRSRSRQGSESPSREGVN